MIFLLDTSGINFRMTLLEVHMKMVNDVKGEIITLGFNLLMQKLTDH